MVVNNTKIYQKNKKKSLLSTEKYYETGKTFYCDYKKLFSVIRSTIIIKSNDESINLNKIIKNSESKHKILI